MSASDEQAGRWLRHSAGVWLVLMLVAGCAAVSRLMDENQPASSAEAASQPANEELPPKPPAELQPARPEELPLAADLAPTELTVDDAVRLCLINDPRIRAGLESIMQAQADAVTASIKPNPIFFTDAQLLQLVKDFTPTRQGGPPQQDVQLGYPIDWFLFGKRAAAMVSAAQGVRVSQAEYEDLIRQRVTLAALAFYDVLEAEGLLRLSRQDVESLRQIAATTQQAVDAGGRPQVEVNRIRLALLASQRTLREAESHVATATARLNALIGGALINRPITAKGVFDRPLDQEVPSVEGAYESALQFRPDLSALRWRIQQAQADIVLEDRKAYPNITMTFGYTRQYQLHTIGFPDADSWSAALQLPLPISDRNQGNRLKAQSVATQTQFDLQAGELEVWTEIAGVLAELRSARANSLAVSEQELQLAEQVLESIRQSFAIGGRSLLDLLDAQRSYRETYRAFITTRANYWRAHARYESAIGRQALP